MDAEEVFHLRKKILLDAEVPTLTQLKQPPHMNIFLFGGMGAGKSSLVNTLFSAVGSRIEKLAFTKLSNDQSITLNFTMRDLTPKICIYDGWGWSKENYKRREFEYILKGRMKQNFQCEEKDIDKFLFDVQTAEKYKVHCAVFLVPIKSHDNSDYLNRLKQFQKEAETYGVRYIVAVTQVDKNWPELRDCPQLIHGHDQLKQTMNTFSQKLGIEPNLVMPVMNYYSEDCKVEYVDILALRILQKALEMGVDDLRNRDKEAKFNS